MGEDGGETACQREIPSVGHRIGSSVILIFVHISAVQYKCRGVELPTNTSNPGGEPNIICTQIM